MNYVEWVPNKYFQDSKFGYFEAFNPVSTFECLAISHPVVSKNTKLFYDITNNFVKEVDPKNYKENKEDNEI